MLQLHTPYATRSGNVVTLVDYVKPGMTYARTEGFIVYDTVTGRCCDPNPLYWTLFAPYHTDRWIPRKYTHHSNIPTACSPVYCEVCGRYLVSRPAVTVAPYAEPSRFDAAECVHCWECAEVYLRSVDLSVINATINARA